MPYCCSHRFYRSAPASPSGAEWLAALTFSCRRRVFCLCDFRHPATSVAANERLRIQRRFPASPPALRGYCTSLSIVPVFLTREVWSWRPSLGANCGASITPGPRRLALRTGCLPLLSPPRSPLFSLLRAWLRRIPSIRSMSDSQPVAAKTDPSIPLTPGASLRTGIQFRVDTNIVLVPLTVTDPMDRLVTGLEKQNFSHFRRRPHTNHPQLRLRRRSRLHRRHPRPQRQHEQ